MMVWMFHYLLFATSVLFFFFKQKTAYEMRISDWSSDVCSSDLLDSGRVMITSQNHGFSVDESTLPANARVTHRSLFDGSNQGFELTDAPAFSFQGHPEASPGPHDVAPLFDRFIESMRAG